MKQLKKLFDRIKKWEYSTPIGAYRYTGHPTIYQSTTGEFRPSEREILVHRYLNRYITGKYLRYQLHYYKNYDLIKSRCWNYAFVLSAVYGNDRTLNYGYIEVDMIIANTLTKEKITIEVNTTVIFEEITEEHFNELVKMVKIQS